MRISNEARQKLKKLEGFRGTAYIPIPGDVFTIGYGFTHGVKEGDTITHTEADARLVQELAEYEQAVYEVTGGAVTQHQFDALVLFAFNVGIAGMRKSSVIKAHNRGDYAAAARAFGLWNKAGGRVVQGLVNRRAAEAAMYSTPDMDAPAIPQRIDPEKPMASSSINRAGLIGGGTAAIATTTEVINSINTLKYSIGDMGTWLLPALLVVTLCAVGYMVWERFNMRDRGQA